MPAQPQGIEATAKRLRDQLEKKSPAERLQIILLEISDEADALKESRQSGMTDDPTVASSRRVVALKEMGNLIVQLEKLGAEIDLNHPILKVLSSYIFEVFENVLRQNGIPQPQIDVIFSALYGEFSNWEKEVDSRYKAQRRESALKSEQREESSKNKAA